MRSAEFGTKNHCAGETSSNLPDHSQDIFSFDIIVINAYAFLSLSYLLCITHHIVPDLITLIPVI
jgi:hypothetical protein